MHVLGFVTADSLDHLGLSGHVAVYVPSSYSFAGHLLLLPTDRITPVAVDGPDAMAFVVSGGVARTAAPEQRNPAKPETLRDSPPG